MAYATVGALITSRQPGNRVGLLFTWVGASAAVALACGGYATLALERDLPFVSATAWIGRVGFAAMFGPLAFLFLIFPTGQPPSHRWRWILRVMLVAYAVNIVGFALTPGPLGAGFSELEREVQNPIGLPLPWKGAVSGITEIAGLVVLAGALLSIVSLIQRFRRASGVERQQIRWLLFLAAFLGALVLCFIPLAVSGVIPEEEESFWGNAFFFVFIFGVFLGIPAMSAIAILRYRLYDLDFVIKKTVLYGVLVVLIVGVAGAGAFLLGRLFVPEDLPPVTLVVIGAVAGVLLWPLRRLATQISDRLVYGGRTSAYEAMTIFSHRVGDTYASEEVLPRMASIIKETARAEGATVWLLIGREFRAAATTGRIDDPPPVAAEGDELPPMPADYAAPVKHQGQLLGALAVSTPANDPIDRARERLVDDLASQAGAVVRNVRLVEDLRASRKRLVAAQDEERRRLERNIHDGAQQQLVALSVKLRLLEQLALREPAKAAEMASELQAETATALEDLRDLARGIYPPLLADRGLPAALEAQARKSPVAVTVMPDGVGRYPQDVESALYFCCLEALQNIAKYAGASRAEIRLSASGGEVAFVVADDGEGFDPSAVLHGSGLQGMADRLEAVGGTLEIRSRPGSGTTVTGRVPVGTAE
ncbi:MAG: GAF domain-containing sensor histidine kinase [Actinomycetota bacterium]